MFEHFLYSAGTEIISHIAGWKLKKIEKPGVKYDWTYAHIGGFSLLISLLFFCYIDPEWPIEAAMAWGIGFNRVLSYLYRCGKAKKWID